jgi:hypothetical protein
VIYSPSVKCFKNNKKNFLQSNESSNNKIIVIEEEKGGGGLGDHLIYTTLPELYSKLGYKVYISSKSVYRTDEMYDLVWKLNPYIEGISDLPRNAGRYKFLECLFDDKGPCEIKNKTSGNFIKDIEMLHGLTNGYRKYPVLYYKPKLINELENVLLYDTKSFSSPQSDKELTSFFKDVIKKYPELKVKKINYINKIENRDIEDIKTDKYDIKDISHLCDAIFSCKVLAAGFSGSSVLASAIKQDNEYPIIYSYIGPGRKNSWSFVFKNVNYSD